MQGNPREATFPIPNGRRSRPRSAHDTWLEGEGHDISQQEQEEFLRIYGTRKQRKAIEEH